VTLVPPAQAKSRGKLSFRLDALARSASLRAANASEQARALSLPEHGPGSLMRNSRGQLLVDIRMTDLAPAQLQALRAMGAQIVHVSDRYRVVTALADAADLTRIADLRSVQSVTEELAPERAILPPGSCLSATPSYTRPGATIFEGDTQLDAANALDL
jgi:hypothetical protein